MLLREKLGENKYICAQGNGRMGRFGPKPNLADSIVEIPGGDIHGFPNIEVRNVF
jgi:hypothetical protein